MVNCESNNGNHIHSHSKNCWDGPVVLNRCLQTSFLFLVPPNLTLSISVEFGTSDTPLSYRIRFTGQQCCLDLLSWSFIHQTYVQNHRRALTLLVLPHDDPLSVSPSFLLSLLLHFLFSLIYGQISR